MRLVMFSIAFIAISFAVAVSLSVVTSRA